MGAPVTPSSPAAAKPRLVVNDEAIVVRAVARDLAHRIGNRVEFVPRGSLARGDADWNVVTFRLHMPDGRAFAGTAAIATLLAEFLGSSWLRELGLRWPAAIRILDRLLGIGMPTLFPSNLGESDTYGRATFVMLRLIALVFLCAFVSAAFQLPALSGAGGLAPARDLIQRPDLQDLSSFAKGWHAPTLLWWNDSDAWLVTQCWIGAGLATLAFFDIAAPIGFLAIYILYLSVFRSHMPPFASLDDIHLLQAGLLAFLMTPWRLLPSWVPVNPPLPARWACWFFQGCIISAIAMNRFLGERHMQELKSLYYELERQAFPSTIAWYLHQLPLGVWQGITVVWFVASLLAPAMMFGPRRMRRMGGWILIGLQVYRIAIGATGPLPWILLAVALLAFDDACWKAWPAAPRTGRSSLARMAFSSAAAIFFVLVTITPVTRSFEPIDPENHGLSRLPEGQVLYHLWASFRQFGIPPIYSRALKDEPRKDWVVEGTADGIHWKPYRLRWSPDTPEKAPVSPLIHSPRLEWALWINENRGPHPWMERMAIALLNNDPQILRLFSQNPFPNAPPRQIRIREVEATFTTLSERAATGAWWKLEPKHTVITYSPRG
jgi:hypothetical protein